MKSPSNEGDESSTSHLLSPNDSSSTRPGFQPIELLDKKIKWKSPNKSGYCPDHKLFSTNWLQGPIAKDNIHIIHWMWIGQTGAYIKPSPPCCSVFGTESSSAGYSKRKVNTKPTTKPLIYNMSSYLQNMLGQWWHKVCGTKQPASDLT